MSSGEWGERAEELSLKPLFYATGFYVLKSPNNLLKEFFIYFCAFL